MHHTREGNAFIPNELLFQATLPPPPSSLPPRKKINKVTQLTLHESSGPRG